MHHKVLVVSSWSNYICIIPKFQKVHCYKGQVLCLRYLNQDIIKQLIHSFHILFRQDESKQRGYVWQDATVSSAPSSEVMGRTSSHEVPGSETSKEGHPGGQSHLTGWMSEEHHA